MKIGNYNLNLLVNYRDSYISNESPAINSFNSNNLDTDIVSFSGRKNRREREAKNKNRQRYQESSFQDPNYGWESRKSRSKFQTLAYNQSIKSAKVDLSMHNILKKPLVSTPNSNFVKELAKVTGVLSLEQSSIRIASLSKYLKENMVGFAVPEYEIEGEKKGGYQWFERGLENLLKGCKKNAVQEDYPVLAEELFGLLSLHDNYWNSPDFVDYLTSLKQSETIEETQIEAVDATVQAIKELNDKKILSFTGTKMVEMFGHYSPLKAMFDYCAYTGVKLDRNNPWEKHKKIPDYKCSTADHIVPKSWDGPDDDGNFLIVSSRANNLRDNISLLKFLKGHNPDYNWIA